MMWCSHLLQRNLCKTRTLLFSPPLRNIISCNLTNRIEKHNPFISWDFWIL
jgi:hypothetical protein